MKRTPHERSVSALIASGASFDLVAPVMEQQDGCFVGTCKGVTLRVILRKGKMTDIWGEKSSSEVIEVVKAAIGAARCQTHWLGS